MTLNDFFFGRPPLFSNIYLRDIDRSLITYSLFVGTISSINKSVLKDITKWLTGTRKSPVSWRSNLPTFTTILTYSAIQLVFSHLLILLSDFWYNRLIHQHRMYLPELYALRHGWHPILNKQIKLLHTQMPNPQVGEENCTFYDNNTKLHLACLDQDDLLFNKLMEEDDNGKLKNRSLQVNVMNSQCDTPLHLICAINQFRVDRFFRLLKHGADLRAENKYGYSMNDFLHMGSKGKSKLKSILEYIESEALDLKEQVYGCELITFLAIATHGTDLWEPYLKLLTEQNFDINIKTPDNKYTLLDILLQEYNNSIVGHAFIGFASYLNRPIYWLNKGTYYQISTLQHCCSISELNVFAIPMIDNHLEIVKSAHNLPINYNNRLKLNNSVLHVSLDRACSNPKTDYLVIKKLIKTLKLAGDIYYHTYAIKGFLDSKSIDRLINLIMEGIDLYRPNNPIKANTMLSPWYMNILKNDEDKYSKEEVERLLPYSIAPHMLLTKKTEDKLDLIVKYTPFQKVMYFINDPSTNNSQEQQLQALFSSDLNPGFKDRLQILAKQPEKNHDFIVTVCTKLNIEECPLLEKYIVNLPKCHRLHEWANTGVEIFSKLLSKCGKIPPVVSKNCILPMVLTPWVEDNVTDKVIFLINQLGLEQSIEFFEWVVN